MAAGGLRASHAFPYLTNKYALLIYMHLLSKKIWEKIVHTYSNNRFESSNPFGQTPFCAQPSRSVDWAIPLLSRSIGLQWSEQRAQTEWKEFWGTVGVNPRMGPTIVDGDTKSLHSMNCIKYVNSECMLPSVRLTYSLRDQLGVLSGGLCDGHTQPLCQTNDTASNCCLVFAFRRQNCSEDSERHWQQLKTGSPSTNWICFKQNRRS